ncbi:MAG: LPS assembly lipoprotein LptE [Nitrospirota bacterium]|nr:LPS assembly lipoprotein LptE [Nitrospirota bacterium]
MKRYLSLTLLAVCSLLFAGCGYHFVKGGEKIPYDVKTVAVPTFANKTLEPSVEVVVTDEVIHQLIIDGRLKVVEKKDAESILTGAVTSFSLVPLSFSSGGVVTEYRVTMGIDVKLLQVSDQKVLWKDNKSATWEYRLSDSSSASRSSQDSAIRSASKYFAESMVSDMLSGF